MPKSTNFGFHRGSLLAVGGHPFYLPELRTSEGRATSAACRDRGLREDSTGQTAQLSTPQLHRVVGLCSAGWPLELCERLASVLVLSRDLRYSYRSRAARLKLDQCTWCLTVG